MNRYRPNEPTSPVPLDLLTLLLRSDEARIAETVSKLSERQRAALAVYCYARAHMRPLGLVVARGCAPGVLEAAGGTLGLAIAEQAESGATFDADPQRPGKKKVTLAKFAA
ncbi:hypothetical protein [Aureimonas endophytica]|nr:hypothetical protein [Aureimonas endophytica]